MRTAKTFIIKDIATFKKRLLYWSHQNTHVSFLDTNAHRMDTSSFEAICAVGAEEVLAVSEGNALQLLRDFKKKTQDWLFGYISYDVKNEIEDLSSQNCDRLGFNQLSFFRPKKIILIREAKAEFLYLNAYKDSIDADFEAIGNQTFLPLSSGDPAPPPKIKLRVTRDAYLNTLEKVLEKIYRGDIYEVNICQEFYAEGTTIDVLKTFWHLNQISEAPFSCFLKEHDHYVLCASPERYLKGEGTRVISQPIKGTAARSGNPEVDAHLKGELAKDLKERSENIMIVDLVRNDLSRVAKVGSVNVDELCAVYSFKQVHQMISTVSAEVDKGMDSIDIIKASFPMGSMTGAPKVAAMEIIEEMEQTKRGVYSGAVGYFTPTDDFDFNVVIRTILYNSDSNYVSFTVGSAITAKAIPSQEYAECLLKAKAMREALESSGDA